MYAILAPSPVLHCSCGAQAPIIPDKGVGAYERRWQENLCRCAGTHSGTVRLMAVDEP